MPRSDRGALKWLLLILILLILAALGYYYWTTTQTSNVTTPAATPTPTAKVSATPTTSASIPADWKTYENSYYGFSFKYPKDGSVTIDNLNANTSAVGGKRKLTINVGDNDIVILGDFEGGFEDAAYFYQLAIQNSKLNVTKKEKAQAGTTANYVTSYVLPVSSDKSLFIQYMYPAGQLDSALKSYDTILSTFQFTK